VEPAGRGGPRGSPPAHFDGVGVSRCRPIFAFLLQLSAKNHPQHRTHVHLVKFDNTTKCRGRVPAQREYRIGHTAAILEPP
jgi:hypothetical protein